MRATTPAGAQSGWSQQRERKRELAEGKVTLWGGQKKETLRFDLKEYVDIYFKSFL